jgi:hypothetical protein
MSQVASNILKFNQHVQALMTALHARGACAAAAAAADDNFQATASEFLSKFGMFNNEVNKRIDAYTKSLGRHLQRQSCKDYSHSYFSGGIYSNYKKDRFAEVLVILLLLPRVGGKLSGMTQ